MKTGFLQALIVLVPTYTVAYLTDKMVYVVPMLAASSFIAAGVFNHKIKQKVDEE